MEREKKKFRWKIPYTGCNSRPSRLINPRHYQRERDARRKELEMRKASKFGTEKVSKYLR